MAGNPLISLGQLNRLKASVVITDFPALNIIPSFLGQEGISLSLDGEATGRLPQMTGVVNSPEPYMAVTIQIPMLKTLNIADLYKQQMEIDTQLGDIQVRPDVSTGLGIYSLSNGAIMAVGNLDFGGRNAVFGIALQAVYYINANLWN